jgi:hypothetical protein
MHVPKLKRKFERAYPGSFDYYFHSFVENSEPPPLKPMDCCDDLKKLLKVIIKQHKKEIIPTLGDFPAEVPSNIASKSSGIEKIKSLGALMLWQIKQLDAIGGQYPFEIEIKDIDPSTEGEQSKKIEVPNMAEGLAEIFGIILAIQAESNITTKAAINAMIEAGMAKKAATVASEISQANAEFLGYQLHQKERKMQMTFNIEEEETDKVLKTHEIKYLGYENTDKLDLHDYLRRLLEMASMYKAANFVNVRDAADIANRLGININALKQLNEKNVDDEFDKFTDEVEEGFINAQGISNNTDPWGKPNSEKPRIREIDKKDSN